MPFISSDSGQKWHYEEAELCEQLSFFYTSQQFSLDVHVSVLSHLGQIVKVAEVSCH